MQTSALMAIVVCLVTSAHALAQPNFDFHQPIEPPRNVQVTVHRGMACAAPENSAIAIEMCAQDYCEWAEIDVRLSKDGHHVIVHNETVDATTNGTGRVGDLSLQELKKLDAGSWFAKRFASSRLLTLTEALELAKGKINLVLDCTSIHPKLLVEEVIAAGMERQVIVFSSPENVTQLQTAAMGKVACMAKFRPRSMTFDEFVQRLNPAAVEIDVDELTPALCQQFHAIGIKVQVKVLGKDWDNPEFWGKAIDARADWLQTDDPVGFLFFSARRTGLTFPVKIAAHRGANRYAPENTLPAIHAAARLGLDYAEIDIRTTLDGSLVLMHDNTLNRTTDRKGTVRETTYEETKNLNAGEWFGPLFRETRVPSFDDGLRALGETMGVYLDAKEVEATELVAAIHKFHLEERHVVYQSVEYCKRIHELEPRVRTLPPLKRIEQLDAVAAIQPYGVDTAWSILSEEMIAACHKRGIQVFSDAIGWNETVGQYQQAIGWEIDCIQTDHPLRVLRAIEELADLNAKYEPASASKMPRKEELEQVLALSKLTVAPEMHAAAGFANDGELKAIFYDALPWQGRSTKVFAWLGIPKNRTGKVPAVVLLHGGGGTAFKEWVRKWNERGYAAISIAVEGQTDAVDAAFKGPDNPAGWKRHAWPGPNRKGIYADSGVSLKDQWMYHAVADTVLANSLLRSLPEVDDSKVGLMGISWGGVIASTVIGIDDRFAFAIPTYGCGHLYDSDNQYGKALGQNSLYREVWDPMVRMNRATMPTLWFSWPEETHFPLDSHAANYNAAPGPHMVSLIPRMGHGHEPPWNLPDSYAFADSVVREGKPWCVQSNLKQTNGQIECEFQSMKPLDSCVLVTTTDTGFTGSRNWIETPSTLTKQGESWLVTGTLPAGTTAWFANVRSGNLTASSDYQQVP